MRPLRLAALLAVLALRPACALAQYAANVRLDAVAEQVVAQQREATGQIVSLRRAAVATQEPGLVVRLDLLPGDAVEQGQVIARLDDDRARLEVNRWSARIEADNALVTQRTAELAQARRDLERIEKLASLTSAGESEMDSARTLVETRVAQHAEAVATLHTSEAELALARRTLDDMIVRAPFAGRVVAKHTETGQWLGQGEPIVTIVSLTQLEARADIPERSVGALQQSDGTVEVIVPALAARLTGRLVEIVPEADSLSRLFPIRLRVDDPEGRLRPGMSLTAVVPTGESAPAMTISEDAIRRNAAGEFVFYDLNGKAQVAPVVRLFKTGDRVAVRSQVLQPGMLVVIEGNERLYPDAALNVINADQFPAVAERQRKAAEAAQAAAGKQG